MILKNISLVWGLICMAHIGEKGQVARGKETKRKKRKIGKK